ncbi:MAG: hypothetical protein KGY99_00025 [Phycisphaerae bacterium]|nr:hypothetical protein [Phycisphaerae bacterium]
MKHVTTTILLAALAFASTATGEGADGAADEKVSLKIAPKPGLYELVAKNDVDQTLDIVGGPTQRSANTTTMTMRMDVSKPDEDEQQTMQLTFTRFAQVNRQGNRVVMKYDSADPPKQQNPQMKKAFGPLLDATLTFTVSADGEVVKIAGLDELWEAYEKQFGDNPQGKQIMAQLKQSFGNEALRKMMQPGQEALPDEPVAVSESWEARQEVAAPFVGKMSVSTTAQLAEIEKRDGHTMAIVDIQGNFERDETDDGGQAPEGVTFKTLEGTQNGQIVVDTEVGIAVEMSMTQDMAAEASVRDPSGNPHKMTISQKTVMSSSMSPVSEDEGDEE